MWRQLTQGIMIWKKEKSIAYSRNWKTEWFHERKQLDIFHCCAKKKKRLLTIFQTQLEIIDLIKVRYVNVVAFLQGWWLKQEKANFHKRKKKKMTMTWVAEILNSSRGRKWRQIKTSGNIRQKGRDTSGNLTGCTRMKNRHEEKWEELQSMKCYI